MHHLYARWRKATLPFALSLALITGLADTAFGQWVEQDLNLPDASTGIHQVEVVNSATVWVTGYDGSSATPAARPVFSRTTNGGSTWAAGTIPATSGLDNSSLSAVSGTTAWAGMVDNTNGGGELYKTTNGGSTWTRQLSAGFVGGWLDGIHMFSATNGIIFGDPVNNEFEVYTTTNGGTTWTTVPAASLPDPETGEFGLINVLAAQGSQNFWFGTNHGRVYRTTNGGQTWSVSSTPLGEVDHIAFTSATDGIASEADATTGLATVARTTNGGATWTSVSTTGLVFNNAIAAVPGATGTYLSAGANTASDGSSYSTDNGTTWITLESGVQRTAIAASDVSNIWAGAFSDGTTSAGGIFKGSLPSTPPPVTTPPNWVWASSAGAGTSGDITRSTAHDANGNVFVGGYFGGTTSIGGTSLTSAGQDDGFVAKYNSQGVLQWVRQISGTAYDRVYGIAVDGSGNVFATGLVQGDVTVGALSYTTVGVYDAIVVKYNAAGLPQWVQGGGGAGAGAFGNGIACDASGNAYLAGSMQNDIAFGTTSLTATGLADMFVASYGPTGTVRWAHSFGSADDESVAGIDVTSAGVVTVSGAFGTDTTDVSLDIGSFTLNSQLLDGFVASLSATGSVRWAHGYGGAGSEGSNAVAVDAAGNAYSGGYQTDAVTFAGSTLSPAGSFGTLLVSYDATGNERWVQNGGGPTGDSGYDVATDATGNVYMTGFFQGTATFGGGSVSSSGGSDIFVAQYSATDGTVQWLTKAGGTGNEQGRALAVDGSNVYVAGTFTSPILTFASGITRTYTSGSTSGTFDGFVAKLGTNCTLATPTLTSNGPICAGQTLTLTGGSIAAGTSVTLTGPNGYSVTTGTGSIPNAQEVATGVYTLTVTSTSLGCSTTATTSVSVQAAPATPTAIADSICGPGSVSLSASGAPAGGSYAWYTQASGGTAINGATSSSYATPSLTGSTTYYVSALSSAGCVSPRVAVRAIINQLPTAAITAGGPTTFCNGGSVTLTAGGGGASYIWSTTESTPSITVTSAGSYVVTATNARGCSATSAPVTVTVNPAPSAPSAAAVARCGAGSLTLHASGAGAGNTYAWYTASLGGTRVPGTAGDSLHTPPLGSDVIYYVSVLGASCESPRTAVVAHINAIPMATLTAGGATTVCQGNTVTLTASGTADVNYTFYKDAALVSNTTPTTLGATESGQYTVTATTAAGCTATSAAVAVTVNPTANATFSYSAATYCLGGSAAISPNISGSAGGAFTVSPVTGLGIDLTTGVITLSSSTAGVYVVSYTVGGTCPSTSANVVTLTNAPLASFSYPATAIYCAVSSVPVAPVLAQGSLAGTFSANPSGLTLDPATGAIVPLSSAIGTYVVTNLVAASGTCPAAVSTDTVTIIAVPAQPSITQTPQTTGGILLTSSNPTGNQWYLNGTAIPGATGTTYLVPDPSQNGDYSVVSTVGQCASPVSGIVTVIVVGTAPALAGTPSFTLAPNPTAHGLTHLTLTGARPGQALSLTVLDMLGRAVQAQAILADDASAQSVLIDLSNLPAGVYTVRLGTQTRVLVRQ